ncbi:sodium- and chloride-dependent GABA transporter ine-like [Amblyomma americanum]
MLSVHVTTTIMLLSRAAMLDGSTRGLDVFFHADWSHITNVEMWSRALTTCLESVGVTGTIYLGVERFNSFKNKFQEDVTFVLVADVASKGIVTTMAFLFLGHLSSSVGIDIATLIDTRNNFIVSITPQAISLATDPEFWSQVHLLWRISMMLPKFLIVPDIVIEVLSASHPTLLLHRGAVHLFICTSMFVMSIAACSPLFIA